MGRTRTTLFVAALAVATCTIALKHRTTARADTPHEPNTHAPEAAAIAPAEAMQKLRDGNDRFVNQRASTAHRDIARREEIARGQHPFAVVLGCADSRVPPEVIFDQGLGDLFVIRVAGEVAPREVIGSIEYAVEHLGCRTIIVLGHERCGAVEAALSATPGPATEGNLGELIKDILPAIEQIDRKAPNALHAAMLANVQAVARTIVDRSNVLGDLSHKGEIRVAPARYDLDTGKVEFLEHAPAPGAAH